jgi:hypothetical protein
MQQAEPRARARERVVHLDRPMKRIQRDEVPESAHLTPDG